MEILCMEMPRGGVPPMGVSSVGAPTMGMSSVRAPSLEAPSLLDIFLSTTAVERLLLLAVGTSTNFFLDDLLGTGKRSTSLSLTSSISLEYSLMTF